MEHWPKMNEKILDKATSKNNLLEALLIESYSNFFHNKCYFNKNMGEMMTKLSFENIWMMY